MSTKDNTKRHHEEQDVQIGTTDCPNCGSKNAVLMGREERTDGIKDHKVCEDCPTEYTVEYELAGVQEESQIMGLLFLPRNPNSLRIEYWR